MSDNDLETAEALCAGQSDLFALLAARLRASVGYDLLTVLAPDQGGKRLIRHYSSRPDQFPLGEGDHVADNHWFRHIFQDKKPVVANDDAAIRAWLPEFTNAKALGYESLLNFPVVMAGDVVGLINIMAGRNHFDPRGIEEVRKLAPLAALALAARASLPTIRLADVAGNGA
jgi:hypothetical protein